MSAYDPCLQEAYSSMVTSTGRCNFLPLKWAAPLLGLYWNPSLFQQPPPPRTSLCCAPAACFPLRVPAGFSSCKDQHPGSLCLALLSHDSPRQRRAVWTVSASHIIQKMEALRTGFFLDSPSTRGTSTTAGSLQVRPLREQHPGAGSQDLAAEGEQASSFPLSSPGPGSVGGAPRN